MENTTELDEKKDDSPTESNTPKYIDNLGNVFRGYSRTLSLNSFADSGRSPDITDVEIAVCFADLRGFTNYVHNLQIEGQDNKVQHFLRKYFEIYPKAVLFETWSLEPDNLEDEISAIDKEVQELIIPKSYKNLGDGMMIIWELQNASSMEVQGYATRKILSTTKRIEEYFIELISNLTPLELDSFSHHVKDLKMGFGLARGHAWRMDFGCNRLPDYAGSIVNLAARLQGLARPNGIVSQYSFAESKYEDDISKKNGFKYNIKAPKGFGDDKKITIWTSNDVVIDKALKE